MTQSLVVNNKPYLPSAELAKEVGYTSDYISKLAREERVLGTRIGRQWFIEPESLRTYIQQLEVEKSIAKEALSRKRKLELEAAGNVVSDHKHHGRSDVVVALQAALVLACGFFVGALGFVAHENNLSLAEVSVGAQVVAEDFVTPLEQAWQRIALLSSEQKELTAATLKSSVTVVIDDQGWPDIWPEFVTDGQYTVLPSVAGLATSSVAMGEPEENVGIEKSFSDDVVVVEEDGVVKVRPVLRDQLGAAYELRLFSDEIE